MESHNNYKHLVENIGNEPVVLYGLEEYAYRLHKTSNN